VTDWSAGHVREETQLVKAALSGVHVGRMPALLNSAARVSLTSAADEYKAAWQQSHPAAERGPDSRIQVEDSPTASGGRPRTNDADVALAHAEFPSLRYRRVVSRSCCISFRSRLWEVCTARYNGTHPHVVCRLQAAVPRRRG
jgi:hypothetical protein